MWYIQFPCKYELPKRQKKKKKIEGKRKKTWKKLENENLNVFLYK